MYPGNERRISKSHKEIDNFTIEWNYLSRFGVPSFLEK